MLVQLVVQPVVHRLCRLLLPQGNLLDPGLWCLVPVPGWSALVFVLAPQCRREQEVFRALLVSVLGWISVLAV